MDFDWMWKPALSVLAMLLMVILGITVLGLVIAGVASSNSWVVVTTCKGYTIAWKALRAGAKSLWEALKWAFHDVTKPAEKTAETKS